MEKFGNEQLSDANYSAFMSSGNYISIHTEAGEWVIQAQNNAGQSIYNFFKALCIKEHRLEEGMSRSYGRFFKIPFFPHKIVTQDK